MSWVTVLHCDTCAETLDDDRDDRGEIALTAEIKGWDINDDHARCNDCVEGAR